MKTLFTPIAVSLSMMLFHPSLVLAKTKAATHTVVIEGMKFNPDKLTVQAGDTVIWVNKDIVPHTATGLKQEFNSSEIKPSASWKFIARKKGEIPYVCTFHPTMKATLQVQ